MYNEWCYESGDDTNVDFTKWFHDLYRPTIVRMTRRRSRSFKNFLPWQTKNSRKPTPIKVWAFFCLSNDNIRNGHADRFLQGSEGHFDLITDLARAEKDGLKIFCGAMDGRAEEFFHADRGTAAVDIARQRQKFLGFDHFDVFFTDGGSRFFQVQFLCGWHHKNVIGARFADGDERFEDVRGVLSERGCKIYGRNRARS